MLSRLTACCLAALILAPFTAPFRTCDLSILLGGLPSQQTTGIPSSATMASEVNLASVPAISRVGRVRLLELPGPSPADAECFSATATLDRTAASRHLIRDRVTLTTILRV